MIKILYVNGGTMDRGGVSTFMINIYDRIDHNKFQIDFLVHTDLEGIRDKEILDKGGKIFRVPAKSKHPLRNYMQIREIIQKGHYDIIHSHADAGNAFILSIAKSCGVPVRISHCHNTNYTSGNFLRRFLNEKTKRAVVKYATQRWACSRKAGEWLYGVESEFSVIPNAIEVESFIYQQDLARELRQTLKLQDKFIIGHVGRFEPQKNHTFILDVFEEIIKEQKEAHLVLIGRGYLEEAIKQQAKEKNILQHISFLGERSDIANIIQIFDVVLMPSLFEGLSIAMVELQANGLSIICSDTISEEINLTGNVNFLSLDAPLSTWSRAVLTSNMRDEGALDKIIAKGYDIKSLVSRIEKDYEEFILKS